MVQIKHGLLSEHNWLVTIVTYSVAEADILEQEISNVLNRLMEQGVIDIGFIEKQDVSTGLLEQSVRDNWS